MRLLDRARPDVDVAQLGVAAVPGERFARRPCLDDQVVRFLILLARQRRDLAVAEIGVHRGADRKARDQPSARDAVEHREFFGDAHRRIIERDGIAEHDEADVLGPARQRGGDDVRARHQAVAVLVMLVAADGVEADVGGIFEEIEIGVVDLVALHRIEQLLVDVDPDRTVLLPEIVRQIGPRHQVEPCELHGRAPAVLSMAVGRNPDEMSGNWQLALCRRRFCPLIFTAPARGRDATRRRAASGEGAAPFLPPLRCAQASPRKRGRKLIRRTLNVCAGALASGAASSKRSPAGITRALRHGFHSPGESPAKQSGTSSPRTTNSFADGVPSRCTYRASGFCREAHLHATSGLAVEARPGTRAVDALAVRLEPCAEALQPRNLLGGNLRVLAARADIEQEIAVLRNRVDERAYQRLDAIRSRRPCRDGCSRRNGSCRASLPTSWPRCGRRRHIPACGSRSAAAAAG